MSPELPSGEAGGGEWTLRILWSVLHSGDVLICVVGRGGRGGGGGGGGGAKGSG